MALLTGEHRAGGRLRDIQGRLELAMREANAPLDASDVHAAGSIFDADGREHVVLKGAVAEGDKRLLIDVTKPVGPLIGVAAWQANIDAAPNGAAFIVPSAQALASAVKITGRSGLHFEFLPGSDVTSSAPASGDGAAFLLTDSTRISFAMNWAAVKMNADGRAFKTIRSTHCTWYDVGLNPLVSSSYGFQFTDHSHWCKVKGLVSLHGIAAAALGWNHVFCDGTSDYCRVGDAYCEGGRNYGIDMRGNKAKVDNSWVIAPRFHGFMSWPQTGGASTANGHHTFTACHADLTGQSVGLTGPDAAGGMCFFLSGEGTPLDTGLNWGNHGSKLIGCTGRGATRSGVSLELGVYDAQVIGGNFSDNTLDGIAFNRQVYRAKLSGPTCGRNGRYGVNVGYYNVAGANEPIYDLDLTDCHIYENGSDGIYAEQSVRIKYTGNRVHDNVGYGLHQSGGTYYFTPNSNAIYSNTAGDINSSATQLAFATSSVASAAVVTLPPVPDVVTVTGVADITSIAASYAGRRVTLLFTGTAATNGVVDNGTTLNLAGNFAYTPNDTLTLICDGVNWVEVGRSVN